MRRLGALDPEMEDRGVKSAPFVVLVATEMPAILAEVSCLSNPDEAERLGTAAHRQVIAEALVSGIQSFSKRKETHER
jgi:N-acetylmuramoyl-L-alanine amidase